MPGKLSQWLLGPTKNPLDKKTRKHITLSAFLAWVGLGADGLSSSCYGPAESYLALGQHSQLALYLAIATGITVFIISFAYNQIIGLFPNGGGGYKVATELLGPYPGLVAGSALLVDYCLTIVISVASGADALFSLFPLSFAAYKIHFELFVVGVLVFLNLRGMKEAITVLLPIFLGFVLTHLFMVIYGVFRHGDMLGGLLGQAMHETHALSQSFGLFFVVALFLHAYSMGGGTYTGLEAVSNNVNMLSEPRVRTGKLTMFFMALSLSAMAFGIILLYLLWQVSPQHGETLNAIAFRSLLSGWKHAELIVTVTLLFEFGLLFVGANTGFLGGPAVLSNMAMHQWVPHKYRNLSNQLVNQNGILLFGLASVLLLVLTRGHVRLLIILYSANVFLAFAVSLLGLCKHWFVDRPEGWLSRFLLALLAFVICCVILISVVFSQFFSGGIEAILLTLAVAYYCIKVRNHYDNVNRELLRTDKVLVGPVNVDKGQAELPFDNKQMTAVFFLSKTRGVGIHCIMWVLRLFPNIYKNMIFVSIGTVDVESYGGEKNLRLMKDKVHMRLSYFSAYAKKLGFPCKTYEAYGTDPVAEGVKLATKIASEIPNCIFFASQLVHKNDNWFTRELHNETAFALQRQLNLQGSKMMILPMQL